MTVLRHCLVLLYPAMVQVIVTGDTVLCVQAAVLLGHLLHLVAR